MFPYLNIHNLFIKQSLVAILCWLLSCSTFAQCNDTAPFPKTETHAFRANTNGQEYRLFISLPESYNAQDSVHYPVLYLLDGNPFFSLLQSMQHFFVTGEEVPELIIVGIGYPVKNVVESMPYRTLDYTPTSDTAFDHMIDQDLKLSVPTKSGGAEAFLKTLQQEIFPIIEQRYKTTSDRGFAGHSFGALFGAYVLFHQPQLFSKYLLSSVSMPWDNNEMLQEEVQYFKRGNRHLPAQVFLSVGSKELNGMQPLMHQLANALRNHQYKGLQLHDQVLQNETHTSAVTTALNQGLRTLYGKNAKKS